jgi:hypothetical protein
MLMKGGYYRHLETYVKMLLSLDDAQHYNR